MEMRGRIYKSVTLADSCDSFSSLHQDLHRVLLYPFYILLALLLQDIPFGTKPPRELESVAEVLFRLKTSPSIDDDLSLLASWSNYVDRTSHGLIWAITSLGTSSKLSVKKIALDKTLSSLRQSIFEIFKSADVQWNVDVKGTSCALLEKISDC